MIDVPIMLEGVYRLRLQSRQIRIVAQKTQSQSGSSTEH
jgi:hypothetical protein